MSKQRTYTGHSGQLAVMAELLFRQCNAAVPVVDRGTDLLAFLDDRESVARIQVKTAQGDPYRAGDGYRARFGIPLKQLVQKDEPPLHYVLVARVGGRFADFVILSREELRSHWRAGDHFGTVNDKSGDLVLKVQFRPHAVRCGGVDLTPHRNAWDRLLPLRRRLDVPDPGTG